MMVNHRRATRIESLLENELVVIEAESSNYSTTSHSSGTGFGQAAQYLENTPDWYNVAYACGPHCTESVAKHKSVGLISLDDNGRTILVRRGPVITASSNAVETVKLLLRCTLLQNLSRRQRVALSSQVLGHRPSIREHLETLTEMPMNRTLQELKHR